MMGTMAFVAGLPLKRVFQIGGIILIGLILAISSTPYRRERLQAYLHPEANCQGSGYQACQALIAVGSGGVIGLGLGSSVQAYGYLPEAANDSIFAIYAEKFGFIGSVALLGVFVAFFARLKSIAERSEDDFARLLVIGVLAWLSVQTLVNVGAMIGLLPLKGITLPFISYGGTSVVFTAAAVGLAFQASQYTSFQVARAASVGSNDDTPTDPDFGRRRLRPAAGGGAVPGAVRRVDYR
jgi:cell division protein FtsW